MYHLKSILIFLNSEMSENSFGNAQLSILINNLNDNEI